MAHPGLLVASLLTLCLASAALAADRPVTPARGAKEAVQLAIDYLREESEAWMETRKCAACHHVPMPLWAMAEAMRQGYAVDGKFLADTTESLLGSKSKLLASRIFPDPSVPPDPRPQGRGLNMGLPFLVVAARAMPKLGEEQERTLGLVNEEIARKQQADGSWEFFDTLRRPPINECKSTDMAWIILALQDGLNPGSPDSQRAALSRAVAWLDAQKPSGILQDRVMQVLIWSRSKRPGETIRTAVDELIRLQRTDGGWSQFVKEPHSDAFATGQALYALSLAGYTSGRPEVRRGVEFLVSTQAKDGSWPMRSRSTPNGAEGGAKDLSPITCAASSWATLALSRLVPNPTPPAKP